jgi:peptide deformylase
MSVPDFTGDVGRPTSIVVRGMVPGPDPLERIVEADAFEARAFGHELDHLEGLLFLDRVAGAQAVHPRKRYL